MFSRAYLKKNIKKVTTIINLYEGVLPYGLTDSVLEPMAINIVAERFLPFCVSS